MVVSGFGGGESNTAQENSMHTGEKKATARVNQELKEEWNFGKRKKN